MECVDLGAVAINNRVIEVQTAVLNYINQWSILNGMECVDLSTVVINNRAIEMQTASGRGEICGGSGFS